MKPFQAKYFLLETHLFDECFFYWHGVIIAIDGLITRCITNYSFLGVIKNIFAPKSNIKVRWHHQTNIYLSRSCLLIFVTPFIHSFIHSFINLFIWESEFFLPSCISTFQLIFFFFLHVKGHLYCEDCYGKYLAPDCEKCRKKILGVS